MRHVWPIFVYVFAQTFAGYVEFVKVLNLNMAFETSGKVSLPLYVYGVRTAVNVIQFETKNTVHPWPVLGSWPRVPNENVFNIPIEEVII